MILRAQDVRVEHNFLASPVSGLHTQYELHVDPENPSNMMICGYRHDPKDNALYGYLYTSSDRGRTWRLALEPKNSTFESEESCAYGVHGVAYYLTNASRVIDDYPHHELGTARIYVSEDSGETWKLGATTGWNDYTTLTVDRTPGANQNRLYSYFNNLSTFYSSIGQKTAADSELKESTGTRIGVISYRDGDASVAGPFTSEAMAKENYHGSYPAPAIELKDDTIVTIFTSKRSTAKNEREVMVNSVRTSPDRTSLEAPVRIVDSLDSPSNNSSTACGGYYLGSAGTYGPVQNKLYFAFSDVRGVGSKAACHLFLTTSTDGAQTWTKPEQVYAFSADGAQAYDDLAIAVNKDGLVAFLWSKAFRSGCSMFATLAGDGETLSHATPLGTCAASDLKPSHMDTAYLWDSFFQADSKQADSTARINLRNTYNASGPHGYAIAALPDGSFQTVWSDAANGDGELRTANIHVTPAAALIANATPGLADVTSKVSVLYGGNQSYEPKAKLITIDVVIKNNSEQPLSPPFKLTVPGLYKDDGLSEIANADNKISGGGAVWDISSSMPGGTLAPGATSKPFALKFRYLANEDTPRASDDILGLNVRVFAAK